MQANGKNHGKIVRQAFHYRATTLKAVTASIAQGSSGVCNEMWGLLHAKSVLYHSCYLLAPREKYILLALSVVYAVSCQKRRSKASIPFFSTFPSGNHHLFVRITELFLMWFLLLLFHYSFVLQSIQQWNHMVFVFLFLTLFASKYHITVFHYSKCRFLVISVNLVWEAKSQLSLGLLQTKLIEMIDCLVCCLVCWNKSLALSYIFALFLIEE